MSVDPRFPIGKFQVPEVITPALVNGWIEDIAATPGKLRAAVAGLSAEQLDTPYREGGWTVRQVVHHVPDSHMNCFIRFKLALTEDEPVIKPYDEGAWALLGDVEATPVETSLVLLETLHVRWVNLLRGITAEGWKRKFLHTENGPTTLERAAGLYAWHGKHHVAHIVNSRCG